MLRKLTLRLLWLLLFVSATTAASVTSLATLATVIRSVTLGNVLFFIVMVGFLFFVIIFLRRLLLIIILLLLIRDFLDSVLIVFPGPPVLFLSDFVLLFLFLLLRMATTPSSALTTSASLAFFNSRFRGLFLIDDFSKILGFVNNLPLSFDLLLLIVLEPWRTVGTEVESHFLSVLLRGFFVIIVVFLGVFVLLLRILLQHHLLHGLHLLIKLSLFITVLFEYGFLFLEVNFHFLGQRQDVVFLLLFEVFVIVHEKSVGCQGLVFFMHQEHVPDFVIFVVFIPISHHHCIFDVRSAKSIQFLHHLSRDFPVRKLRIPVQEKMDLKFVRRLLFFNHYLVELWVVQVVDSVIGIWVKIEIAALTRLAGLTVLSLVFPPIVTIAPIIIPISKFPWFVLCLRALALSEL